MLSIKRPHRFGRQEWCGQIDYVENIGRSAKPDPWVVAVPKDVTIGYLPQVMILSDVRTVMEEAELAFEHIFELQANLERMNQQLAGPHRL